MRNSLRGDMEYSFAQLHAWRLTRVVWQIEGLSLRSSVRHTVVGWQETLGVRSKKWCVLILRSGSIASVAW